jgi:putative spermidine/putrescine transport system ATP-binding protein
MSDAILELRDLRRTYGSVNAVDGVSIKLAAGEFLSFLGPSGSGKTTTLSMIAGLAAPSSGEILLRGQPLNPLPPYRRNIGVVFQNYALFPHMSAAKNIAFPLEMRGVPRADIEKRVARVLALVGLSTLGARLPSQLSGGQQQRIALARAIVFEPPLLLMDEPLGALDKKLREQMQIEIKQLHRNLGISIIYVTHDQEEALTMSNRIAVFNNGRIEQLGRPAELYEHPKTRFVANFIGETNLFPGTVSDVSDGWCQVDCDGLALRARSSGGVAKAQSVSVAVRPERTLLCAPGEAHTTAEDKVSGVISETIYLGQSMKYVVNALGTQVRVVQQMSSSEAQRVFSLGDAVEVRWRIQDATAVLDAAT